MPKFKTRGSLIAYTLHALGRIRRPHPCTLRACACFVLGRNEFRCRREG